MLYLIRHASTGETGAATFPATTGADPAMPGARLDHDGRMAASALRTHLPPMTQVWSSHADRALDTARLALRDPDQRLPELAEVDFGRWAGRVLAEVHATEEEALARWMTDPGQTPPGGESFDRLRRRAAEVLGRAAGVTGHVAAVGHGGLIRVAVMLVLGAPPATAGAVGIAPASVTVLEAAGDDEHWQVRTLGWTPALPGGDRVG